MFFLNEFEIELYQDRYDRHPILGPATRTLRSLVDGVNSCTDGWAYWGSPVRAAEKLMRLVEDHVNGTYSADASRDNVTEADLKAAYTPLRRFVTANGPKYGFTVDFHLPAATPTGTPLAAQGALF